MALNHDYLRIPVGGDRINDARNPKAFSQMGLTCSVFIVQFHQFYLPLEEASATKVRSEMTVSLGLYENTIRVHSIVEPQYLLLCRTKPQYIITERIVLRNKRTQPIDALCGLFMGSEEGKLMSGVGDLPIF